MPKTQKTFMIDNSMAALLDERILKTGCTFSHLATAGLLRLLLESTAKGMNDETWMSLAVQIHRGTLTFEAARILSEAPSGARP